MRPKDIPRSPHANERNAGLPQCKAIAKGTGKQCRAKVAGREALERLELLQHEHAGEYCAFHLFGARVLADKGHAGRRQAIKERKLAAAEAEKLAALPGVGKPADRSRPGEEVVEIDATLGVLRRAGEDPADLESDLARPVNLSTIEVGSVFQYLTPEQRKKLLRARMRGS
jgi:hypothetical protein